MTAAGHPTGGKVGSNPLTADEEYRELDRQWSRRFADERAGWERYAREQEARAAQAEALVGQQREWILEHSTHDETVNCHAKEWDDKECRCGLSALLADPAVARLAEEQIEHAVNIVLDHPNMPHGRENALLMAIADRLRAGLSAPTVRARQVEKQLALEGVFLESKALRDRPETEQFRAAKEWWLRPLFHAVAAVERARGPRDG